MVEVANDRARTHEAQTRACESLRERTRRICIAARLIHCVVRESRGKYFRSRVLRPRYACVLRRAHLALINNAIIRRGASGFTLFGS